MVYISVSYEGYVLSIDAHPVKNILNNIYLDENGMLVIAIDEVALPYYNDSTRPYFESGKINQIGQTYFYYFGFDYPSFLLGKLYQIGDVIFTYNSYNDPENDFGKIKKMGDVSIEYYDMDEDTLTRGRARKVGDSILEYDEFGRITQMYKEEN